MMRSTGHLFPRSQRSSRTRLLEQGIPRWPEHRARGGENAKADRQNQCAHDRGPRSVGEGCLRSLSGVARRRKDALEECGLSPAEDDQAAAQVRCGTELTHDHPRVPEDLHDDRSSFTAEQSASASLSVSVRVGCSEREAVRDALLSRGHLRTAVHVKQRPRAGPSGPPRKFVLSGNGGDLAKGTAPEVTFCQERVEGDRPRSRAQKECANKELRPLGAHLVQHGPDPDRGRRRRQGQG
jgi:hypothetical protein